MQYNCLTNGDTIRDFILSQMNESASLLLMEYPVNVWKQSETKHNELVHVNGGTCLARNAQCCIRRHVTVSVLLVLFHRNARWRCRKESSSCKTFWWFPCRECWSITYYSRQEHTAHGLNFHSPTQQQNSRKTGPFFPFTCRLDPWEATEACAAAQSTAWETMETNRLWKKRTRSSAAFRPCWLLFHSSQLLHMNAAPLGFIAKKNRFYYVVV